MILDLISSLDLGFYLGFYLGLYLGIIQRRIISIIDNPFSLGFPGFSLGLCLGFPVLIHPEGVKCRQCFRYARINICQ